MTSFKSLTRPKLILFNCLTPSQASLFPLARLQPEAEKPFLLSIIVYNQFSSLAVVKTISKKTHMGAKEVLIAAGVCCRRVIASTRATAWANTSFCGSSVMHYGKCCF